MIDHRPIRVLFVDHTSERGGAEIALKRLLETQTQWDATLHIPTGTEPLDVFSALPSSVTVVRSGPPQAALSTSRARWLASIKLIWTIARSAHALRRHPAWREADVVVANSTRSSVYVTLAALGTHPAKKVVVHLRDLVDSTSIGAGPVLLIRRLVLPRADAVIANSNATLNTARPFIHASCIAGVIPSPAGLFVRGTPVVSSDVRRIGMVARIDPWKGQSLLLSAFARAFPDGDSRLVLIGGTSFGHDEYDSHLRHLARDLGVADRVDFAGHVDDVQSAIDALDVCVQCSLRAEPLGQNVLQYLARGKVTIAADEGGPTEWVTDGVNGILFAARSEESLAAALVRVATDSTLRRQLAEGARGTPGLLSDAQIATQVWELLAKVADR